MQARVYDDITGADMLTLDTTEKSESFFPVEFTRNKIQLGAVLLLVLVIYAWSFPGNFHVDDYSIVIENPLVQHPSLHKIFLTDYWGKLENSGLYRPVTILSLAINHQVLGPQPWGFLLGNLLLFVLSVVLLYLLLLRLTADPTLAVVAAALYGVHPIHAEVINTAVGRSELLVAVFVLLGLLIAEKRRRWGGLLAVVCYAGAFLSKEHGVVFPLLLLFMDLYQSRSLRVTLEEHWKLYLSLLLVFMLVMAQRTLGVVLGGGQSAPADPTHVPLAYLGMTTRLLDALWMQMRYLEHLMFPIKLLAGYGGETFWSAGSRGVGIKIVLMVLLAGAAGWVIWRGWTHRRLYSLMMIFYVISFSVTANLVFVTGVTFADRLAFLPSLWFCTAIAALFVWIYRRKQLLHGGLIIGLVGLVLLAGLSMKRNLAYGNPIGLWGEVVAAEPDNAEAWLYLATAQSHRDMAAAGRSYARLIAVAPRFEQGLTAYAEYLLNSKDPQQAAVYAQKALHAHAGITYPLARLVLARALIQLGQARAALEELSRTQNLFLSYGVYWETQGRALEQLGDHLGAINAYQKEEAVYFPETSDVLMREGEQLLALKQYRAAEEQYRREIDRHAGAAAWDGLGVALALQHRYDEAESAFRTATLKSPEILQYQNNLREVVRRRMNGGE